MTLTDIKKLHTRAIAALEVAAEESNSDYKIKALEWYAGILQEIVCAPLVEMAMRKKDNLFVNETGELSNG